MKKLLLILLLIMKLGHAQDPEFSQTYMQSMYLNPALTGHLMGWQANTQYRNQWPGISNAYVTYNLGIQKQLTKYNTGLGLRLLNDQAGNSTINTTGLGLNYARWFSANDNFQIAFGMEAEFQQKSLDLSKLTFGDMIDNRFGFEGTTSETDFITGISFVNFAIGTHALVYKGSVGLVLTNLFEPNQAFTEDGDSPLPRRLTVYGSHPVYENEILQISPIAKMSFQSSFQNLVFGVNTRYKFLNLFLGARNEDAVISGLGYHNKRLKVQYSYDYTISKLTNEATGGSHELGLIFRFGSKEGYDDDNFTF